MAIRHPDRVHRLVLVSATFDRNGWYPSVIAQFDHMGPAAGEEMKQSPLNQIYPNVNWSALFKKLGDLERKPYDWSEGVRSLNLDTMLVFADSDAIRPEHMIQFYELLGGGKQDAGLDGSGRTTAQLAILPGLTHYTIGSSLSLATVVTRFLDAPTP
jgi:pimeloyl-ACP methyl ester carboxylesterase